MSDPNRELTWVEYGVEWVVENGRTIYGDYGLDREKAALMLRLYEQDRPGSCLVERTVTVTRWKEIGRGTA